MCEKIFSSIKTQNEMKKKSESQIKQCMEKEV